MSLETHILLKCLIVPAVISALGALILSMTPTSEYWDDEEPLKGLIWSNLFGALVCGLAFIIPDLWGRDLLFKPNNWRQWEAREPWMWLVWIAPATLVGFAIVKSFVRVPARSAAFAWPLTAIVAAVLIYVALPQSQGYEEKLPLAVQWVAVGMVATMLNMLAVSSIATNLGSRWNMLVVVAQAGAVALLAFQSYASLGMWSVIAVGVGLGASLIGGLRISTAAQYCGWPLSPVAVILCSLAVANIATTEFYLTELKPRWLIAMILFLPTIVGLIDLCGRRFGVFTRAVIAAIVSVMIIGVEFYWFEINKPEW